MERASLPQGSEAHGRTGYERPIHAQLDAVVEAVDRQLQEAVELKVVREGVDEARAQKNGLRSAQIRLRVCARVLSLDQAIELQQSLPVMTEGIAITDVELELIAGFVFFLGAHRLLIQRLDEPARIEVDARRGIVAAEHEVGASGPRLQRAFRNRAVGVVDAVAS